MAEQNVIDALDKVLQTYKVGGDFSTQRAEQLKGTERKYTAGAQQGLVSRGLAGTTIAASIPGAFEQDVAAPYRTETERLRSGSEMQGLLAKAGFLQADEDRALREKLATADIESREKIARMGRGGRTTSTSKMTTLESLRAEQDARFSSDSSTPSGTSQHTGMMGNLDFGIDYGGGGGGGGAAGSAFGGVSMDDLTAAERSTLTPGYYHDENGYPVAQSGDPNDPVEPIYKSEADRQATLSNNPELRQAMDTNLQAVLQKLMGG